MFPAPGGEHPATLRGSPDDCEPPSGSFPSRWSRLLASASRSCCCPAHPAVVVLIPPSPGRSHRTDLLLCRHHYRASRQALAAAGAILHDPNAGLARQEAGPLATSSIPADW